MQERASPPRIREHLECACQSVKRPDASPLHYVRNGAPPFLLTYCQWDYYTLPKQSRDFEAALKKAFVDTKVVYIPRESHISEMVNIWKDGDRLAQAILDFVR